MAHAVPEIRQLGHVLDLGRVSEKLRDQAGMGRCDVIGHCPAKLSLPGTEVRV